MKFGIIKQPIHNFSIIDQRSLFLIQKTPKTMINSRLYFNRPKENETPNTIFISTTPNLQTLKDKSLSGMNFVVYKGPLNILN